MVIDNKWFTPHNLVMWLTLLNIGKLSSKADLRIIDQFAIIYRG